MAIAIQLKVYEGGKLKSARLFRAEQIRLGSGTCDLVLEGPGVLPTHAVIDAGATGAVLRASGSAPIHLNGQPIIAAPLRHGDLISIGDLRVMVELRANAPGQPERRPRLQLIQGEEDPHTEPDHLRPALSVVREAAQLFEEARHADGGLHAQIPEMDSPSPIPVSATGAMAAAPIAPPSVEPVAAAVPRPATPPPIPASSLVGGDCIEAELFWGETRLAVWQLAPGQELTAGTAPGCQAQLEGLTRAVVVRSDASGWVVCAPRPLTLALTENGKTTLGPELLVRGRSQADAQGLLMSLPAKGVALLGAGQVALRVRRVPTPPQVAAEPTDWKGMASATVAALVLVVAMKMLSQGVPPPRYGAEAEVIRPKPLIVRTTPKPTDPLAPVDRSQKAEGRKDPGKAVARHQGQEGQAGSKTAPRRDARAERARDEHSIVASSGLLKALGAGKGASDVFGVALEKGTRDAMGHLTGPKVGEARGDGGMGLK
ncbi:MAG: FHA domain-containing protein, partial [Myxococcales bacterium]